MVIVTLKNLADNRLGLGPDVLTFAFIEVEELVEGQEEVFKLCLLPDGVGPENEVFVII